MSSTTVERSGVLGNFDHDGYVIFRNVIDAELLTEVGDHLAWLEKRFPGRPHVELGTELPKDPFWVRLISDDRLVDIGSLFVGPDIALFAANYVVKEPFTGKRIEWHQDGMLWPLEPREVVTLGLAIDKATPENGCVRVLPGSHKLGPRAVIETDPAHDLFGKRVDVDHDESEVVDLVLNPGDVEVHHPLLVHSSNANTSSKRRAWMNIHYIPTSTVITTQQQPYPGGAIWLRGKRGDGVFNEVPEFVEGESFPFRDWKAWA